MDCSPPGFFVHGISQARILECVAILFQGIFLTQGLNLCCLHLLHYRLILYPLSHLGMLFSDQLCPILCDPMVCPWNSLGKNTGVGCHSLLQGIFASQASSQPMIPCTEADSLPADPQGKPKNTGVGIPSPADLPDLGIEIVSPALQADSLPTELSRKPYLPKVA